MYGIYQLYHLFQINDSIILVTIAMVHPILLKPFLQTQSMHLGQINIDMCQKTLK